jgi:hypothetical protein
MLQPVTPPLGTPFFGIITIPISIYGYGHGDDSFCGGSHVQSSRRSSLVSLKRPARNATLAPSCSYYASCAVARGEAVGALGSQTLGMTYRVTGTQVALSIEVGMGLSKSPLCPVEWSRGGKPTATLALSMGVFDPIQPSTPPIRSLYTRSLRKKRIKRRK